MGLRDKIKGALHNDDKDEERYDDEQTSQGATLTKDDPRQQHTGEGFRNENVAGHHHRPADSGVDLDERGNPRNQQTSYGGRDSNVAASDFGRTGTGSTGGDRGSTTQDPYWGSMNQQQQQQQQQRPTSRELQRKDLPLRPGEQSDPTTSDRRQQYADPSGVPVGGGRYAEQSGPVGSGGDPYGGRSAQDPALSQTQQRGGYGAAGAAGAVGAAGAGYAATQSRDRNYDQRDPAYATGGPGSGPGSAQYGAADNYARGGGVPQSSLLDPQPGSTNPRAAAAAAGPQGGNVSYAPQSTMPGGQGQPGGPGASSGMGNDHFGPGHSGAKVMHKCVGCGMDNDISHYFSKDVTYRMG